MMSQVVMNVTDDAAASAVKSYGVKLLRHDTLARKRIVGAVTFEAGFNPAALSRRLI